MAVPEDTGYPLKWFKQQESVRNTYECGICFEVLKDPVQVRDCGHQFCRNCLDGIFRLQSWCHFCPLCHENFSKEMVFNDNAAKRAIDNLNVNCPNTGCEWNGQLSSLLKEHTGMCPFFILTCSNVGCNVEISRRNFNHHLAVCEHRTVVCQYCNNGHVFKDKVKHCEICPSFPLGCKNKCSQRDIPRNKMKEHLEKVCIKTVINCKHLEIGCKYKCERREMEEHLNQEMKDHLELSTLEISRLKDQHQNDIKKLRQEIAEVRQRVTDKLRQEIAAVKVCHITSAVIIRDFNRKLSEAKDSDTSGKIYGDPFLTSPLGYKIKMLVYLNDTREEYKDHMGVFICPMKTDHDAMLSWPFKKRCTFTLIDQQDNEQERKNIVTMITPAGEDYFKRPKDGESRGGGRAKFVSHATLKTRKYIKDDTVFITVDIQP